MQFFPDEVVLVVKRSVPCTVCCFAANSTTEGTVAWECFVVHRCGAHNSFHHSMSQSIYLGPLKLPTETPCCRYRLFHSMGFLCHWLLNQSARLCSKELCNYLDVDVVPGQSLAPWMSMRQEPCPFGIELNNDVVRWHDYASLQKLSWWYDSTYFFSILALQHPQENSISKEKCITISYS
jgi:hypothetical protein